MEEGTPPNGIRAELRAGLRRLRTGAVPVLVAILCCTIVAAPALSSGTGVVEERYPDDGPPEECIGSPEAEYESRGFTGGEDDRAEATAAEGDGVVGVVRQAALNRSVYLVEFRVPASRSRTFTVGDVPGAEVVSADGFGPTGDGEFAWDGSTENPRVRVRTTGRTLEGRAFPFPSGEDHLVGRVLRTGPDVELRPAGEGVIGARFLVLDGVDRYRTTVGCQTITLVVPDAVDRERLADPDRVLRTLAESARRLDVGHVYRDVRVFAMPGLPNGTVAGQARANEFVVYAGARLSAAWNVWIHEYVHTRQGNLSGEEFGWFREASASYLSVRLALEQGLAAPRDHDGVLAKGGETEHRLLADGTDSEAGRLRGAAVLSRLAAMLSDHDRTVGDLLAWANDRDRRGEPPPSQRQAERRVEDWTGSRVKADRFRVNVRVARPVEPDYASGPRWLPPWIRRLLRGLGHPIVRTGAGILLVGSLLTYYRDVTRAAA
ncbi:hypothetical protein BRD00_02895 [Halobacteriales archaeon QS_8_69_26]|nr:MAG: hypothetical protein BRD00_02895 [Halobacteriales archaeon QS_8_69_26]